jgi:nucleoside-diphosphate-sugar epimerase
MRTLVIGGNRFLGVELVTRLLARGDSVTLLNRGTLADPFGDRVTRLRADRSTDAFDQALAGRSWDAVVDFALFTGPQAERTVRVLRGRTGHYVAISTGQVYLVRTPRPKSFAAETDFPGPVLAAPPSEAEAEDWRYGIEKRDAEDVLAQSGLPRTIFRIPMVHGPRDHKQRLERVLWQLVDRQPIRLREPDLPVRQVFSGAVTRALVSVLERGATHRPWNLAFPEPVTVRRLLECAAATIGAPLRLELDPEATTSDCFLNSRWMSALDPSDAVAQLGFTHEPLETWLGHVASAWLARL